MEVLDSAINRETTAMRVTAVLLFLAVGATAGCARPKTGILVMAHGGDEHWNEQVQATVEPLRGEQPVEIAFGMAQTSTLRAAVERLEAQGAQRIAVVRMFISGESFLPETEYILGLRPHLDPLGPAHHPAVASVVAHAAHDQHGGTDGDQHGSTDGDQHGGTDGDPHAGHGTSHAMEPPQPIQTQASLRVSRSGVGESPLIDEILVDRVRALSTDPAGESVLILAHGPGDEAENERWLAHMRLRVQRLHAIGPFRHVHVETLREDWPHRRAEAERRIRQYVEAGGANGGRVIVVPFRIAGFGPYAEVLEGLDYVADGRGFCPHPNMTRWIEITARECLAEGSVSR
ncbi:MAG: hypothetical protein C4547_04450 [Phycisphaerales bacterium]|nr:MAG: hypothetical protein C4547_04450 [Phycisphaerales bacterium]